MKWTPTRLLLSLLGCLFATWGCAREPAAAQAGPSSSNTDVTQLRAIVDAESARAGTQGVLFGMWVGDKEILTTALGNSVPGVPATTDMHFRIGGITETFQSTLVLMLAEQGRINLDDKISRWLPDLLAADQVTVRMLVANTAGYLDYVHMQDWVDLVVSQPFRVFTDEELIDYSVRDGKMKYSPPGSSQAYSHTEYVILGQVIMKATGQPMKELYEQNILGPLGLKDTQFPTDATIQPPVLHSWVNDRNVYEDCTACSPSWASATGALTSNLHDLGRWGPIFGKGKLISPASLQELTGPSSVGKGGNKPEAYFAYGFVVSNGWFVQNPDLNGYTGGFAYNPSNGVTLMVEATKNENPAIDPPAIHILREVIKYVTPATPLTF